MLGLFGPADFSNSLNAWLCCSLMVIGLPRTCAAEKAPLLDHFVGSARERHLITPPSNRKKHRSGSNRPPGSASLRCSKSGPFNVEMRSIAIGSQCQRFVRLSLNLGHHPATPRTARTANCGLACCEEAALLAEVVDGANLL